MRNPAQAVAASPTLRAAGERARGCIEAFLDARPDATDCILRRLGGSADQPPIDPELTADLRRRLASAFDAPDWAPVSVAGHPGHLIPGLIESFDHAAGDQDVDLGPWLRHGAPLGILNSIPADDKKK